MSIFLRCRGELGEKSLIDHVDEGCSLGGGEPQSHKSRHCGKVMHVGSLTHTDTHTHSHIYSMCPFTY